MAETGENPMSARQVEICEIVRRLRETWQKTPFRLGALSGEEFAAFNSLLRKQVRTT